MWGVILNYFSSILKLFHQNGNFLKKCVGPGFLCSFAKRLVNGFIWDGLDRGDPASGRGLD